MSSWSTVGIELLNRFTRSSPATCAIWELPYTARGSSEKWSPHFPHSTRVFVVRLGMQPVAASLVHWHRDILEVPWASSLRPYNALCPNVLLYWEMLRFAIEHDMRVFDFGRSTPGEGTFHFKRQWGAEPQELIWESWLPPDREPPELSPRNPRYRAAIALWRRLPLCLTTFVGPHVARGIP